MKYKGFKQGLWTGISDHQGNQICNGDEILDLTSNIAYIVKYEPNMAAFIAVSGETKILLCQIKLIKKK